MAQANEIELVITSLNKQRNELLNEVAEIDKVIKKIKYGGLNLGLSKGIKDNIPQPDKATTQQPEAFPIKAELRVQALKVLDLLGVASKLSEIRDKYHEITGLNVNFRETLRTLNKHDLLKLLQPKGNIRGLYWVKTEWIDDEGNLKEQHKFHGFELLFTDDMIEFK
jgi:hypothetical protein